MYSAWRIPPQVVNVNDQYIFLCTRKRNIRYYTFRNQLYMFLESISKKYVGLGSLFWDDFLKWRKLLDILSFFFLRKGKKKKRNRDNNFSYEKMSETIQTFSNFKIFSTSTAFAILIYHKFLVLNAQRHELFSSFWINVYKKSKYLFLLTFSFDCDFWKWRLKIVFLTKLSKLRICCSHNYQRSTSAFTSKIQLLNYDLQENEKLG
jgi:hypothetical protein